MEASVKQYFLAPNSDYPPDGPIQLGRIFTSPKKLLDAINPLSEHLISIPADQEFKTTKKNFKTVSHPDSGFKVGLFAGFLQQFLPISANVELEVNRNRESILSAEKLETKFFDPSDEYVSEALNVPAVLAKVGEPNFFSRLFMITGVKVVHGGSKASWSKTVHVSGNTDAQADLTALGAAGVSPGGKVGGAGGVTKTLEWEAAESPYVFAYRLREIQYRRGKWVSKPYDRGALYTLRDRQEEDQNEKHGKAETTSEEQDEKHVNAETVSEEYIRIFINMVADEDLSADDLDSAEREGLHVGLASDDDDDRECTFVSLLGEKGQSFT